MKPKAKKKKKPTFSKKDWREITDRTFCALAISMMTQAFKVGVPLLAKDIPTDFVPIVPPFTKPATKTPNPAFSGRAIGGRARMAKTTKAERNELAKKAAKARWGRKS